MSLYEYTGTKEAQTKQIINNKNQSFIPVQAGILIAQMVGMCDSWVCRR